MRPKPDKGDDCRTTDSDFGAAIDEKTAALRGFSAWLPCTPACK